MEHEEGKHWVEREEQGRRHGLIAGRVPCLVAGWSRRRARALSVFRCIGRAPKLRALTRSRKNTCPFRGYCYRAKMDWPGKYTGSFASDGCRQSDVPQSNTTTECQCSVHRFSYVLSSRGEYIHLPDWMQKRPQHPSLFFLGGKRK
jgi:hypothetical protein